MDKRIQQQRSGNEDEAEEMKDGRQAAGLE
jgi:hypothetical protein